MNYQIQLDFFEKLIQNYHLSFYYITEDMETAPEFDYGLRRLFNPDFDYLQVAHEFPKFYKPNIIYKVIDSFLCNYLIFQLPDMKVTTHMVIGPYALVPFTPDMFEKDLHDCMMPVDILPQLSKFYHDIPIIPEESRIMTIIYTLGEYMWGSMDNFSVQNMQEFISDAFDPVAQRPASKESEDPYLSMQVLEERYAEESKLMQAVSQGQIHKAELHFNNLGACQMEQRIPDNLRNKKNYAIVLNTLLRKAAEAGAVHPLHIDSLSSKYARKIELTTSINALATLQREMVHKYCLLVKNHSMKGYSLLVRKVLTQIDSDLTSDLSLRNQAEKLNINSSYLSTLFKKETGATLTEYVNRKRVEHAIFLLNTTNLQIQTIAQSCGIPDVNYFTKIFKKHIGITPKDYRDNIMNYKRDVRK